jgi:hypothetical protein
LTDDWRLLRAKVSMAVMKIGTRRHLFIHRSYRSKGNDSKSCWEREREREREVEYTERTERTGGIWEIAKEGNI